MPLLTVIVGAGNVLVLAGATQGNGFAGLPFTATVYTFPDRAVFNGNPNASLFSSEVKESL